MEEQKQTNKKGIIIGGAVAVVAIIAVIIAVIVLNNPAKKIAGNYELIEMTSEDGTSTSRDEISAMKSLGFKVTLQLNKDNTGVLDLMGETTELTYDKKNITVDGESCEYTVEDNKVIFTKDGDSLIFEKTTD